MKRTTLLLAAAIISTILMSSCTKDYFHIEGRGDIITETLHLDDFTSIKIEGIDDVIVNYGPEQKVVVTGHSNIINKIRTNVYNKTWHIKLEDGNYRNYELTYYLTLPLIESIDNTGTADVTIESFIDQQDLDITMTGTGNFYGFPMNVENCKVHIDGTSNCEVNVEKNLDVTIDGVGKVYYKGYPSISTKISGLGSVIDKN